MHCISFHIIVLACGLWSVFAGKTSMEDKLETEIEYLSPRVYQAEFSYEFLGTRQMTFGQISYNRSGVISTHPVNSIDFFQRYNYQTRDKDMICPMHPQSIATFCDWALMNPCLYAEDPSKPPRTIFVYTPMLTHFAETTLKNMDPNFRFVLLSGGTDATIPRSFYWDRTFRGFSEDMNSLWGVLLKDPRIIHWFAENHDLNHPKISSLPTGFVFFGFNHSYYHVYPPRSEVPAITQRPLMFLSSDKVRSGTGVWADRAYAIKQCDRIPKYCLHPENSTKENGLSHYDYVRVVASYPFIACVHGAGIDPSPKAWEAIMLGTIPIIQHSTLDDAYERLPVVFVHEWKDLFEYPDIEGLLKNWLSVLAPAYEEGSALRNAVLERLNVKYWVNQGEHKFEHYIESELKVVHSMLNHNNTFGNNTHHISTGTRRRSLRGLGGYGHSASTSDVPTRLAIEWNSALKV